MGLLERFGPSGGLRGGWLTFWFAVGCGADMALYGYDQVSILTMVSESLLIRVPHSGSIRGRRDLP